MVDVAFTDRHGGVSDPPFESLDLGTRAGPRGAAAADNFALLGQAFGVSGFTTMRQVHGRDAVVVGPPTPDVPRCDALVTDEAAVALCVRVADCAPVVLADSDTGVVAVVHVGRRGLVAGVIWSALDAMLGLKAQRIEAWIGPHVCGGCYEVPAQMRADVADVVPAAFGCTTWGTPSLEIGAGAAAQLVAAGCPVNDHSRCTRESDALYSYRRDGERSGRSAGLVVLRATPGG